MRLTCCSGFCLSLAVWRPACCTGASKAIDHLRFGWNSYMWRRSMEHFVITLHRNILTTGR